MSSKPELFAVAEKETGNLPLHTYMKFGKPIRRDIFKQMSSFTDLKWKNNKGQTPESIWNSETSQVPISFVEILRLLASVRARDPQLLVIP